MEATNEEQLGDRIWREVSQSASSSEIARGISDLLAEYLIHDQFVLVDLDVDHSRLLVVESIARDETEDEEDERAWTIGADAAFDELVEWCEIERTLVGTVASIGGSFSRACPWPPEIPVLVVTLPRGEQGVGFAAARLGEEADLELGESFSALTEPLSAALYYDREMGDSNAAPADRRGARREHFQRVKRRELTDVIMDARTGLGDVVEWVRRLAPSNEPVLLIGEVGTGKEVIARTIHHNSNFSNGPILRVNCGALSEGIVESKLFGGAENEEFTPATRRQPGWFERAAGGTLFLDEIDKLPESAQRRLVEWIDTGEFERPDSSDTFLADLRLVAGNHTTIEDSETVIDELVEQLTTFPIHIPPLRARPEDIPALALQFSEKIGRRIGGAPLAPSAEEIELLVEYDWPGNIRELRSVIERAAIIGNGKRLHIRRALGARIESEPEPTEGEDFATLEQAVRRHLEQALRQTDGQVAGEGGAADLLDLHPSTLRSKLKRHDLDASDYR